MNSNEILNEKLLPLLRQMIRNKCVNDGAENSGHEIKNAKTLKKFFKSYGIESEIFEPKKGRASILARVKGTDKNAPSLMYMGHLDVVPANPEKWSFDPFGGDVIDGYVCGRGCVDMLNMTACEAVGFAEAVKNKKQFKGDLVFLGLADEEASGRLGARYLVENHWDKVKCDYMVSELGGFFINKKSGQGITISIGEKGVVWLKLKTKGKAGHGSMPYKADNALVKITEAAYKISKMKPRVKLLPEYKEMADGLADNNLQKFLLKSPFFADKGIESIAKKSKGAAKFLHTASRNTISPDCLKAGKKINIIADSAYLELDIRVLPGTDAEKISSEILKILGKLKDEIEIEVMEDFSSNISSQKTPLMEATKAIVTSVYPNVELIPLFLGGVTDGRFWRQKGTTVYGFSLFDEEMTMSNYSSMLHGVDEKISLKSLEKSVLYFTKLAEEFYSRI